MSSETPGVGSTPPSSAWPPAAATPAASAASSISPDSRVSRTIRTWGWSAGLTAAAARPRPSARSAVRNSPATPRTPSVPKSLRVIGLAVLARRHEAAAWSPLALRELRALTGLLETRLLALLHACVAREEAVALELAAEVRIGLDERAGDAVTERDPRRGRPAAVDLRPHVHARIVARRLEWQPGVLLERDAREVHVELLAVDRVRPLARLQDHTGDGALALARRAVAGVGGELERRARGGGRARRRLLDARGLLALCDRRVVVGRRRVRIELTLRRGAPLLEHEVGLQMRTGHHGLLCGLLVLAARRALAARLLGGRLLGRGLCRGFLGGGLYRG